MTLTTESDDWMTGTDDTFNRTESELNTKLSQDMQAKGTDSYSQIDTINCSLYFCLLYFVNGLIKKTVTCYTVLGNTNVQ